MSRLIIIDAEELASAAESAQKLKSDVEDTRTQLESLYGQLLKVTSTMTATTYVSSSSVASLVSKKKLNAQAERMEGIVSVMNEAAGLTDTATKNVESELDLFSLMVEAFQTVAVASGAVAVADVFGRLVEDVKASVYEIGKEIYRITQKGVAQTPEEILGESQERIDGVMEIFENNKSNYLGKDRTLSDGTISCVYMTWRKIEQILGSDCTKSIYSSSKMRSYNGKTITADDGSEYLVTTYTTTSVADLLGYDTKTGEVKQGLLTDPAENVVLSFSDGHLMMIDRVENGVVYFSDNAPADMAVYNETGKYPAREMTIAEFVGWYQKYNGSLSGGSYSLTKVTEG